MRGPSSLCGRMGVWACGCLSGHPYTHTPILLLLLLLAGCGTTKPAGDPADPTLVQLTKSAQQAYEIGAYARAARFYELSLERAWMIDDAEEAANNAFNLAACRILEGRLDEADTALVTARGAYERIGRDTTDVLLLQARSKMARRDVTVAGALVEQALKQAKTDDAQLHAWILKTDLACDAGDLTLAQANLASTRRQLGGVEDDALMAGVARVAGRVALLNKDSGLAAREFDAEAGYQQAAHRYGEMARALDRAGEAYKAAAKPAEAADRWYRSARSFYAQHDFTRALEAVDRAMAAAAESGDAHKKGEVAALFERIKAEVTPQ